MIKLFDGLALLGYCGVIFWLSAQESLPMPMVFEFQDKLHHGAAYFVMGLFSWRFFRHYALNRHHLLLVSGLFCSLYGISDEFHQSFVPGRDTSGWDWLADTLGGFLAVGVLHQLMLWPVFSGRLQNPVQSE